LIDATSATVLPDNFAAIHQHLVLEMSATSVPAATAAAIPETANGRYQRWRDLDAALTTGGAISDDERRWHQRYPLSAEWRAQNDMFASFEEATASHA
jgi:putative transposase